MSDEPAGMTWRELAVWLVTLTPAKTLQLALAVFLGLMLWALGENLDAAWAHLGGSPVFGGVVIAGVIFTVILLIVGAMLRHLTAQLAELKKDKERCDQRLFDLAQRVPPWALPWPPEHKLFIPPTGKGGDNELLKGIE